MNKRPRQSDEGNKTIKTGTGLAAAVHGFSIAALQPSSELETLAGYENQTRQTSPSTSFVRAARQDLVADYDALNQPEKAAKFRAELASAENTSANISAKK